MLFRLPKAAKAIEKPSPDEVKELAAKMPNAKPTRHGNLNVQTDVVARTSRLRATKASSGPRRRTPTSQSRT
jgi:hypothetical protein